MLPIFFFLLYFSKVLEILRDHPDFGFEKTDEIATKAFLQVSHSLFSILSR
jgi:hypothetical protein